jgi:hypothetical protein
MHHVPFNRYTILKLLLGHTVYALRVLSRTTCPLSLHEYEEVRTSARSVEVILLRSCYERVGFCPPVLYI